ncbi:hypothetical protein Patl1_14183 [Pistacia atlantica]|uniref:Uncharacterized protein n=1 Tax=Pistacia atlantica TaxID=434234 RepID=A0ACC1AYB9_9ROSI|nr:hypothetical protein Patl1_14183 [Pistacia atlantica]
MGVCLSLNSSSSSTSKIFSNIRVVHLNGSVEQFDFPVSVSQLTTGSPPKHYLFTATQLLSTCLKPLKPDILLERGRLYILLPSSIFQSGYSLADLATIVKKLTAKANSCKAETMSPGSGRSNPSSRSQNNSSLSPVPETNGVKRWRPILDPIREVV